MNHRYIVFDVETPNCRNDRMSAIGVAVVENGEIVRKFDTLVNPECHFDAFNIQLTGITPEAAAAAPTFPQLWTFLQPIFDRGILIAHNAPFDMGVLGKCLRDYGILWKDTADYACTCRMGKCCHPELPNHKLNTMCTALGIPLDHHRAGSDAEACAALLCGYLRRGANIENHLRRYDFCALRTFR